MTSLEQIVLPLAESRALAEKGIVLDNTVIVWELAVVDCHPVTNLMRREVWSALEREYYPVNGRGMVPAPVLSELLDAIRAKVPYPVRFESSPFRGKTILIASWDWGHSECRCERGSTDLLAAASLLLEVAK